MSALNIYFKIKSKGTINQYNVDEIIKYGILFVLSIWATQKCLSESQLQLLFTLFRHVLGTSSSRHIFQLQCSSQKQVFGLLHSSPKHPIVLAGQPFAGLVGINADLAVSLVRFKAIIHYGGK